MPSRIAAVILTLPLIALGVLLAIPSLDQAWINNDFHFWVVSSASLLSAFACLLLILSARTMRETRIMFLALSFFTLGMFFAVHGLATPGVVFEADEQYAVLGRSPWLATLGAGFFAALSVASVPGLQNGSKLRLPQLLFLAAVTGVTSYFVMSMLQPDWLKGFPTEAEWFQHTLTATTIALLVFAAWRYYQSYQFARLPGQLAVAVGLGFLAEAQLSLDFGIYPQYSWWLYHGMFLAAFLTVLFGWTWEVVRAREGSAIAEGITMRDALSQMNRGRPTNLVALADQIENHDVETFRHVDRVAAFAYAIGRELGFSASHLRELVLAAQMHDVGKIGLPPYILTKSERLTDDEWAQIKQHPKKGEEILQRVKVLSGLAFIIRHHHERWEGTGYPDGLRAESIPIESRIIAVADTFDALTSQRPYRPAMTLAQARTELERVAGTQLDPGLVQVIVKLIDNGALAAHGGHPEVKTSDQTLRQSA
jgi:HD-GYP domain-containing protein (c-di-GMP phosphodiesterase class II)